MAPLAAEVEFVFGIGKSENPDCISVLLNAQRKLMTRLLCDSEQIVGY